MQNVAIRKKNNESSANVLRRFTRAVKRSGLILRAREVQYSSRPQSETAKKKSALKRLAWQKNMERLRKLGKIE